MPINPDEIIHLLQQIKGLTNIKVLSEEEKKIIAELEGKENHGVHACLAKRITIALTHNSQFRDPPQPIVEKKGDIHIFPPVPFPELHNAFSSSPSKKVHDFLVKRLSLHAGEEDATLLIGMDHNL